jgi:hypothetical protein
VHFSGSDQVDNSVRLATWIHYIIIHKSGFIFSGLPITPKWRDYNRWALYIRMTPSCNQSGSSNTTLHQYKSEVPKDFISSQSIIFKLSASQTFYSIIYNKRFYKGWKQWTVFFVLRPIYIGRAFCASAVSKRPWTRFRLVRAEAHAKQGLRTQFTNVINHSSNGESLTKAKRIQR